MNTPSVHLRAAYVGRVVEREISTDWHHSSILAGPGVARFARVRLRGAATTTTTAAPAPTTAAEEMGDVLEVAADEGDLTTFLAALEAVGIMAEFHGEGPFTLFIPTDDAFSVYLAEAGMSQAEVFAGGEVLQAILNNHIVNLMEDAEMVMAMEGQSFTTAGGQELLVAVEGETVMVGEATVERYDLHASNGVIHVMDKVLIPPAA
ncbi:MAG: fasciclin domain-containing protein [Acidimicrobiia bacterium]